MEQWTARQILRQLSDPDRRKAILTSFWEGADPHAQAKALAELSRILHFRPDTLRKSSAARKAEFLASRLAASDFEETFAIALMVFHTREKKDLLASFLDSWNIPHVDGSIEVDDYTPPTLEQVQSAVAALSDRYDRRDIAIYLATAGLLMGSVSGWREATWPVVDQLASEIQPAS